MTLEEQKKYYNEKLKGNGFFYRPGKRTYQFGVMKLSRKNVVCQIIKLPAKEVVSHFRIPDIYNYIQVTRTWKFIKYTKSIPLYKNVLKL